MGLANQGDYSTGVPILGRAKGMKFVRLARPAHERDCRIHARNPDIARGIFKRARHVETWSPERSSYSAFSFARGRSSMSPAVKRSSPPPLGSHHSPSWA